MAKLISPDGTVTNVAPANGATFTLEELQGAVGGMIEAVQITVPGCVMFIHEEGKLLELDLNEKATILMDPARYASWDHIVGPALIVTMLEAGEEEETE